MNGKNVMGLIYSNSYDTCLPELAAMRAMGSVPFGGRYRLIDFALSNMVNSGITKVGVITNAKYRSLLDHVGQGKPWDLSRKDSGLSFLPPFDGNAPTGSGQRLSSILINKSYISSAREEFVVLTDCNVVGNIDLSKIIDFHIAKNADITFAYVNGKAPKLWNKLVYSTDAEGKITSMQMHTGSDETLSYSANISVMRKSLMEQFLNEAEARNYESFESDIFMPKVGKLNMYCYELTGFTGTIDSFVSYYNLNMMLLDENVRADLFNASRPILTKVRDDCPTIYKTGNKVANSIVSDGCYIAGTVNNCIISRGVTIEEGAVVTNSVIMQGAVIKAGANLNCVILDKDVVVGAGRKLSGAPDYPFFVGKGISV